MTMAIGGHTKPFAGGTDDWITPPDIVKALGPFDLDPCCPKVMPWNTARFMYRLGVDDGLTSPWFGRVWMNPPYGPQSGAWLQKLATHGNGIGLIFARTDTEFFQKWGFRKATAMLFIEGRLHFHTTTGKRSKNNAGGPSVLIAYGYANAAKLEASGIHGHLVKLR